MATHPSISLYNKVHAKRTLSQPICSFYVWKFYFLIKDDPNIKGIEIFEYCYLHTVYASDATFFLKDKNSIIHLSEKFRLFSDFSELRPNTTKYKFFFSLWVFFHNHSRIIGLQGKGEDISLTPHYHCHPLHKQLDISGAITAGSSPLHIGSSRTQTGNIWFPSASC